MSRPNPPHDTDIQEAFRNMTPKPPERSPPTPSEATPRRHAQPSHASDTPQAWSRKKRPGTDLGTHDSNGRLSASIARATGTSQPEPKRLCSPPPSDAHQSVSTPGATPRSRPPQSPSDEYDHGQAFSRATLPNRLLFDEDADQRARQRFGRGRKSAHTPTTRSLPQPRRANVRAATAPKSKSRAPAGDQVLHARASIVPQPDMRPITHDQLYAEVQEIYRALAKVEEHCIEVDRGLAANTEHTLNPEQWQALILLHRTLLDKHHDFFEASQHPAGSDSLKELPSKQAMPARMWRYGIHPFLEILRHRLPGSYDQMITFIYIAYGTMSVLYETVPSFKDTWIECLGDLARYRMAIEEHDVRDRETWTGVARSWYSLASDKAPSTGRLYHHLAILARPRVTQQLYYYVKSLCVPIDFPTARDSIMTFFFPDDPPKVQAVDDAYVRIHAIFFCGEHQNRLQESIDCFLGEIDAEIARMAKGWLEVGYFIGISLACALLDYGNKDNFIMKEMSARDAAQAPKDASAAPTQPKDVFSRARDLLVETYSIVVTRWGDTNTLPFVHTVLAFVDHVAQYPRVMEHLQEAFPWQATAVMLNYLSKTTEYRPEPAQLDDPAAFFKRQRTVDDRRPLPEDFAMRGLVYTEALYPPTWFTGSSLEEDEKTFELPTMEVQRKKRLLWLGHRIAARGRWLTCDEGAGQFGVVGRYADDQWAEKPARWRRESGVAAVAAAKTDDETVVAARDDHAVQDELVTGIKEEPGLDGRVVADL